MNIKKFNSAEVKDNLNKILSDENNDLVKKIVLLEFIVYFSQKEDYE